MERQLSAFEYLSHEALRFIPEDLDLHRHQAIPIKGLLAELFHESRRSLGVVRKSFAHNPVPGSQHEPWWQRFQEVRGAREGHLLYAAHWISQTNTTAACNPRRRG